MSRRRGPDEIYGELFDAVQSRRLFADSKTFVDATPKSGVAGILAAFGNVDRDDDDALRAFVAEHFSLPDDAGPDAPASGFPPVRDRIEQLWGVLSRDADTAAADSSLIALPRPYIVPGGRFREIYYWDSYFTMLGLAESGRITAVEDMVENFAYLIDTIGFVPNGNRTYFCTRSQPPVFALMVELLADLHDDPDVVRRFLPQLEKEYAFWMAGADGLGRNGEAARRVVRVGDGFLNRYWDDADRPRAESYAEDCDHAAQSSRDARAYYRDIRAAAESGWDFSSRWLDTSLRFDSMRTTALLPVDLNALLHRLESCLAAAHAGHDAGAAGFYGARAETRRHLLQTRFYDSQAKFFFDLELDGLKPTPVWSLAAAYPLFVGTATPDQAAGVCAAVQSKLLAPGGWRTTQSASGQQWDRPNGWAPLQWVMYRGFLNYGFSAEAEGGAARWVDNNIDVYRQTGRLLEKYDVDLVGTLATGGEYSVQDGFGWTNGVLLKLMNELQR